MKKNFLKFGFMLLLATSFVACEKESLSADSDSENDSIVVDRSSSIDSIKITKSAMNQFWNPEEFFGIWKLNHIQYGPYDFTGDSTLWLFYTIEFRVEPSTEMGTTAQLERVHDVNSTYWPQFKYWRVSGKDVIFYDAYSKRVLNNEVNINNHYTLLNYSISNGKLECDVLDGGGPAYKYARKMHCTYSKVKDY